MSDGVVEMKNPLSSSSLFFRRALKRLVISDPHSMLIQECGVLIHQIEMKIAFSPADLLNSLSSIGRRVMMMMVKSEVEVICRVFKIFNRFSRSIRTFQSFACIPID